MKAFLVALSVLMNLSFTGAARAAVQPARGEELKSASSLEPVKQVTILKASTGMTYKILRVVDSPLTGGGDLYNTSLIVFAYAPDAEPGNFKVFIVKLNWGAVDSIRFHGNSIRVRGKPEGTASKTITIRYLSSTGALSVR